MTQHSAPGLVLEPLGDVRDWQEDLYRTLHRHPELSGNEHETARVVVERLRRHGYAVHEGVGGTGVVGVFANGSGPTVLLRADRCRPETLLNLRMYSERTRTAMIEAIHRIVEAECVASGSPKEPQRHPGGARCSLHVLGYRRHRRGHLYGGRCCRPRRG